MSDLQSHKPHPSNSMAWLVRVRNFKQQVGICNQPLAAQTVIKVTAAMAFTSSTKEIYTSQRLSVELE